MKPAKELLADIIHEAYMSERIDQTEQGQIIDYLNNLTLTPFIKNKK